jgi:hypothetical protein
MDANKTSLDPNLLLQMVAKETKRLLSARTKFPPFAPFDRLRASEGTAKQALFYLRHAWPLEAKHGL